MTTNSTKDIAVRPASENVRYRGHTIHLVFLPDSGHWRWSLKIERPVFLNGIKLDKNTAMNEAKNKIDTLEDAG